MARAELTDVGCYYETLGQGPPILLIPGLGNTCRAWDNLTPDLAEHFSVIVADNRGVGRSIARRKPRHLRDYAADLVELLDYLQLDRAHVIGISLGGVMAQRMAIDHPSRVDKLVLISSAHHFGPYLTEMAKMLGTTIRYFPLSMFARTVELLGTGPLHVDAHPERLEQAVKAKCACTVSRWALARQLQCLRASEVPTDQYRITAPTLVIAGEYDALIPNCYGRRMADDIPASRFEVVSGAGHNPIDERPEIVIPLIIDFLKSGANDRIETKLTETSLRQEDLYSQIQPDGLAARIGQIQGSNRL